MTNFDRDPTFDHDLPYENSTGGNKLSSSTYNNNDHSSNNSDYIQTSLKSTLHRRVIYRVFNLKNPHSRAATINIEHPS